MIKKYQSFKLLLFFLSAFMFLTGQGYAQDTQKYSELVSGIDEMKKLPINGMHMVKSGDRTFMMSSNGRFLFVGKTYDVWNQKFITNMQDVRDTANRIDLSKMKFDIDMLNPITVGSGKKEVVLFIDPICDDCRDMLKKVDHMSDDVKQDVTFKIVLLPSNNKEAKIANKQIRCMYLTDKEKAYNALIKGTYRSLPGMQASCEAEVTAKSMVVAQIMGINQVPFSIAVDGRTYTGLVKDYEKWIYEQPE